MIDPNAPNAFENGNSTRDPKLQHNKLIPTSQRDSGINLDPCCANDFSTAVAQTMPGEKE